tara:strand:- start:118 stop:561 length:444 start_codon:yes stop_codon:yes gene_type:complete
MFNYGAISQALSKPLGHSTYMGSAMMWTEFISNFAKTMTPLVNQGMEQQGRDALYNAIYGGLQITNGFLPALKTGLAAYSGYLIQGMLPSFVGTPPTIPVLFDPGVALGMAGAPGIEVMKSHFNSVALYFTTGTAVPSSGGPFVMWL